MIDLINRLGPVLSSVILHGLFILILLMGGISQVNKLIKESPATPVIEIDLSTIVVQKSSSIPNLKEEVKKLEALEKKQDKKAAEKAGKKAEKVNPKKAEKPKEKVIPLEKPKEVEKKTEEKTDPKVEKKTEEIAQEEPEVARPGVVKKIEDGQHKSTSDSNTKLHDLSLSIQDALRVRIRQCWMIDPGRTYPKNMQIEVTAFLTENGTVYRTMAPTPTDSTSAYVITTAIRAIEMCSPFTFLPKDQYEAWKEMEITFSPSDKGIK
ncbi:MAG: hypothetical protein JW812_00605 [Alphaproteobacteria bacterium]|nr:hypothetical protein [Alphaproteobacteria bacterium]MBN2779527.1 hypothetical protein [Alphaproteobacteria bacterium]